MEDELFIHWNTVHVSVGGYQVQIWPLSWAFLASLIATLLIGFLTVTVIVYAARRDHDAKHR